MLLAFDTATHAVTVALHDGTTTVEVVASRPSVDALRHGELLAPGIAARARRGRVAGRAT